MPEGDLFISVITRMEVLAKPYHTAESGDFLAKTRVVPLSDPIERRAIAIRRNGSPRLKLPDAIVAATAVVLNALLITSDEKLLHLVWPGFSATLPPS